MLASRFLLAACFGAVCLLSELADAAEPGFYAVTGVASGDVLNIREEPDANAAIIESLEPGAWPAEAVPAIQNKIGQFTANPLIRNIVGQTKSSFDIRKIRIPPDKLEIYINNEIQVSTEVLRNYLFSRISGLQKLIYKVSM